MNEKWWGYLHSNGSIIVKRYFGDPRDYTTDCNNNPFIVKVVEPFSANGREDALRFVGGKVEGWRK
jgi:hypothetical protein